MAESYGYDSPQEMMASVSDISRSYRGSGMPATNSSGCWKEGDR